MPSFAALLLIATSAFAAMTAAAPVSSSKASVLDNIAGSPVTGITKDIINPRQDTLRSLPTILTDVKSQVSFISDKLNSIVTAAEVDVTEITPLISNLTSIIGGAVTDVQDLAGHPKEAVLALGDKVLSLPEVAHLLGSVLSSILSILTIAGYALDGLKDAIVSPLLAEVREVVAKLLSTIFTNVGGLRGLVLPTLGSIFPALQNLGLGSVLDIFHL